MLLDWANTVHKTLASHVAFFKDDRRTARETLSFAAGQCVSYQETFVAGDGEAGAYVCQLIITSDGLSLAPGGAAPAFVAPAARDHGGPAAAAVAVASGLRNMAIGGVMGTPVPDAHAAAWAAARARAITEERKEQLHQDYVTEKRRLKVPEEDIRELDDWWGVEGKKGGARLMVEGCLGEEQADKLFQAQGHRKLNHGGKLVDALDPPKGRGLDGVWENAAPPPEFLNYRN